MTKSCMYVRHEFSYCVSNSGSRDTFKAGTDLLLRFSVSVSERLPRRVKRLHSRYGNHPYEASLVPSSTSLPISGFQEGQMP